MDMEGALVMYVTDGSGAARAGIMPTRRSRSGEIILGDLIVAIDDKPITSNNDLLLTLEKYKPGDQVSVKVKRDGKTSTVTVTLGSSR